MVSSIGTAVWRLPEGIMLDGTRSFRDMLKIKHQRMLLFDEISEPGKLEYYREHRKRVVREKLELNTLGYKTLLCADGEIVTFMSCCLHVHFEGYCLLHSTIWRMAN